jgi:hypothetical protein
LTKVKKLYMVFKEASRDVNYRYISRATFATLLGFVEVASPDAIFEELDCRREGKVDVYQLLAILIWTAFAARGFKLKCEGGSECSCSRF